MRRAAFWCLAALVVVAGLAAVGLRIQLGRSLPQLAGERQVTGLSAPVSIARDARGVPTITGRTRQDVARALGFVHAQDRFFQMDLSRRRAAGELSELIGNSTVKLDVQTRLLGLRRRAHTLIEQAPPADRGFVAAYAEGVNAGLAALLAAPPEYFLLRASPAPWREEDCVLVLASMFLTLQDAFGVRETRVGLVNEVLPRDVAAFLTTTTSDWETPLSGAMRPMPAIPDPGSIDLRRLPKAAVRLPLPGRPSSREPELLTAFGADAHGGLWGSDGLAGSNNWAVSGAHTRSGAAMVANDMHLGLSVPNTWYRASLAWGEAPQRRVTGLSLPGVPSLVVGSNGDIAWAFTNSTADWSDVVLLEVDSTDASRYRTPEGWERFTVRRETIVVARSAPQSVEVRETRWGPVIGPDARRRPRAIAWAPLRDGGMNLALADMETARSIDEALGVATRAGVPGQNLVVAGRDGRIAWTVAGRIPRRVGFDGAVPTSWADGSRGWDGWLASDEYPRLVDPSSGRIVTANNRVADVADLSKLGDGGYDPGARARQIAERLASIESATPADLLAVQLDDRAVFLDRWRNLLRRVLASPEASVSEDRRELRRVVEVTWTGRASVDSAAYRLVRDFRQHVAELVFTPLFAEVRNVDPTYPATGGRAGEGPLWALVSLRPAHLLATEFASWEDLLLSAADRTVVTAKAASGSVAAHTWGRFNTARIQHPLARAVPQLARWLDLERDELPGDSHMPRVQAPEFGASERLAVSPGHEADGYCHMPGGQSGHPLSPYYRAGHRAWVTGEPTPFLPGPTVHTLVLTPGAYRPSTASRSAPTNSPAS